jgi:hypothetical protein
MQSKNNHVVNNSRQGRSKAAALLGRRARAKAAVLKRLSMSGYVPEPPRPRVSDSLVLMTMRITGCTQAGEF